MESTTEFREEDSDLETLEKLDCVISDFFHFTEDIEEIQKQLWRLLYYAMSNQDNAAARHQDGEMLFYWKRVLDLVTNLNKFYQVYEAKSVQHEEVQ